MAIKTIDVYAYGFEQGTISDGEPTWSANRVRSVSYIQLPATFVGRKLTASATVSTGKTVQVDMVGYVTTSPPDTFDLCWYNSPYTFDLSSYQTTMYFKMCLKYSDNTVITPSEITSCKVTYDDGIVYHAHEGEYPINDSALPIVQTDFTRPFPLNRWRIDQSNDGYPYTDLQLGILTYEPPPPPEPEDESINIVQYDIYCDNQLMHSSVVPTKEWKVIDPVLDLQDSAAGSLEFTLPKFNCMYGKCQMMMSTISVRRNGVEIWEGRPVSFKEDMWLNHPIVCEGELAYLNDIYQPQNKYENVTLQQLIYAIIGVTEGQIDTTKGYNQRAAANRRFNVSYIEPDTKYESDLLTVTVPFQTTLETINNICKTYGLHVYMDNVWNDGVKERRIKFVNDNGLGENVTQTIEFGRNLVDYAKSYNFSSLVTYVLPLGAKSTKAGATVKDNDETVDIKAAGFEQGTITDQGDDTTPSHSKHARRVRSSVYLTRPSGSDSITVTAEPTSDTHGPLSYSLTFYNSNHAYVDDTAWIPSGTPTSTIGTTSTAAYYRVILRYTNDTDENPINIVPSDVNTCTGVISKTRKGTPYGTGDNGRMFVIWPNNKKDSAGNTHDAGDLVYIGNIDDYGTSDAERSRYFVNEYIITEENATVFITTQMKNGAGMIVVHANGQHYYIKKSSNSTVMTAWKEFKFNGWYSGYSGTVRMYVAGYDDTATSGPTHKQTVVNSKVVDQGLEEYVTIQGIDPESNPNIDGLYVHDTDSSFYDNHVLPTDIYGRIEKKIDWSDAKDAWTLYNNAINYLRSDQFDGLEIQLTALDMSMLGFKATQLHCGEMVMCKCAPYGLYKVMPVTAIKIPLTKPEDTKYTVGSKNKQNLTSVNTSNNSELLSLIAEKPSMSAVMTAAKSSAAEYIMDTQNGYVTMRYGESGKPEAIIISDTEDYRSSPTGYWLFGKNGLGFIIPNGGTEEQQAITNCALKNTGEIVADRILTGTMIADRILGGTLKIGHWLNEDTHEYADGLIQVKDNAGNIIGQMDGTGIKQTSYTMDGQTVESTKWVELTDGKVKFGYNNDAGVFIKSGGHVSGSNNQIVEIYSGTEGSPDSYSTLGLATGKIMVYLHSSLSEHSAGYWNTVTTEGVYAGNKRLFFVNGILCAVENSSATLASGSFITGDSHPKQVTVSNGVITSIETIENNE